MTCANEKPALIRIGVYLNSEGHIRGKHLTNSFLQCISFIRKDAQMQSFKFSGGCLCNSHILIIVSVISLMVWHVIIFYKYIIEFDFLIVY